MDFDETFQALAPSEWGNLATRAAVQALYPVAQTLTDRARYGDLYSQAVVLRALHIYVMGKPANSAAGGALIQSRSGPDQESRWAAPRKLDGNLGRTGWGVQLMDLLPMVGHSQLRGYP